MDSEIPSDAFHDKRFSYRATFVGIIIPYPCLSLSLFLHCSLGEPSNLAVGNANSSSRRDKEHARELIIRARVYCIVSMTNAGL